MSNLLLLGGNKLHKGFIDWKKDKGIDEIIVIDWNEKPDFCGDEHIQLDIKDTQGVLEVVKKMKCEDILMCYTSADIAVPIQIKIHKYLELLTPSEAAVQNTIIKSQCTEIWKQYGILNRYSKKFEQIEDINISNDIKDIIVKPNISSGSRGITIIKETDRDEENLRAAFEKASRFSNDRCVVIEEFVKGTEYTVELLGDNYGNVAIFGISQKYHTNYVKNNKIAVKLHYNSNDIGEKRMEDIAETARQCYKAVGLRNSLGHLEIIVSDDGRITPVEMGARSSGFIATHCVDAINDESYLLAYSKVIRGEKVKNDILFKRDQSSMYYFYDVPPGVCMQGTNIMEYAPKGIISIQNEREKLKQGNVFGAITQDAERIGYEILVGKKKDLTIQVVNEMEKEFVDDLLKGK